MRVGNLAMIRRVFAWALLGGVVVTTGACDHPRNDMLSSRVDLRRVDSKIELPPYLTEVALSDHAAYDQLEADFRARHAARDLIAAYEHLRARRPADVLLAVRSAALQLETKVPIQQVLPIVDVVRNAAPDAPDTLYLISLVTRVLFYDPATHIYVISKEQVENAERLRETLVSILDKAPQYRGPSGVTADDIRRDIKALDAAIVAAKETPETLVEPAAGKLLNPKEVLARSEMLLYYQLMEQAGPADACPHGRKALALDANTALSEHVAHWCKGVEERPGVGSPMESP